MVEEGFQGSGFGWARTLDRVQVGGHHLRVGGHPYRLRCQARVGCGSEFENHPGFSEKQDVGIQPWIRRIPHPG